MKDSHDIVYEDRIQVPTPYHIVRHYGLLSRTVQIHLIVVISTESSQLLVIASQALVITTQSVNVVIIIDPDKSLTNGSQVLDKGS